MVYGAFLDRHSLFGVTTCPGPEQSAPLVSLGFKVPRRGVRLP